MTTYISIDGNRIGGKVESYLIANDIEGLVRFSRGVEAARMVAEEHLRSIGATILFSSGDSVLAMTEEPCDEANGHELARRFRETAGCTAAVGIAHTLRDVYLAIKLAKAAEDITVVDYRE
jgi:hypothetical protein